MIGTSIAITTAIGIGIAIAFWGLVGLGLLVIAGLASSRRPRPPGGRIRPG